jgi:hypothetical protein
MKSKANFPPFTHIWEITSNTFNKQTDFVTSAKILSSDYYMSILTLQRTNRYDTCGNNPFNNMYLGKMQSGSGLI